MKKMRVTFYLDENVNEKLNKMAKLLGEPKSNLVNDLIDEATTSFFKILNEGKDAIVPAIFDVLADKLKEVSNEMKGVKDETRE
jgi:hypothetical protein